MTTAPEAVQSALVALAAVAALLTGCTGQRLQELTDDAGARYLNRPVSQAMDELGAPERQRPLADLREYTWTTGVYYEQRGGYCTLALVADRRGLVVDHYLDGTPLGCNRLLGKT
jgi:hypothetical protein